MFAALALEIEPMFSVEAKKRMLSTLKKGNVPAVADLPQRNHAKARDQAAVVCGVSPRMVQRASPPIDYVRKRARGGREFFRNVWRCEIPPPP